MAQQVDEWTPNVLNSLKNALGERYVNPLINVMKETGAVLAGGFVLKSILEYDESVPDLDIYVPYQNVRTFLEKCVLKNNPDGSFKSRDKYILQNYITHYKRYYATIYCRSFLRKNGIRRVHTFSEIEENDRDRNTGEFKKKLFSSVDIMSVRKRRTPVEVCSNFDLTFCQVWFDGTTVFATHPEHIRQKSGFLQGDYVASLLSGNEFLKNRITKYRKRGFKITYDPSVTNHSIPSIDEILTNNYCVQKESIEERLPIWFQRIATKWLVMNNEARKKYYIPLNENPRYSQIFLDSTNNQTTIIKGAKIFTESYVIPEDEGYDSEDMDGPKLAQLAVEKYVSNKKELAPVPIQPDIVLYRSLFLLLEKQFSKHKKDFEIIFSGRRGKKSFIDKMYEDYDLEERVTKDSFYDVYNNFRLIYQEGKEHKREYIAKLYKHVKIFGDYLLDRCTTQGDDFGGNTGRIYHIHNHPIELGITSESLETYLDQYKQLTDTTSGIPCYYTPDCKQLISLRTIETIVSPGYFRTFAKRIPPKLGLDLLIPFYDSTIKNTKTSDPQWGDEYNETICPFCLDPVSRSSGCTIMVHENINKLPESQKPYCKKEIVVQSILDNYRKKGQRLLEHPDLPLNIEFCIECGRPCSGHQHFDINSVQPALLPDNHDYGKCPGGGRPELFARIMAVREVYKYGGIKDLKQERLVAAWAADAAARDPVYLARGAALAAKEPADNREFNVKVPAIKKYKENAYKNVSKNKANSAAKEAKNTMANVSEAPSKTAAWVKVWVDAISAVKVFDENLARQTAQQAIKERNDAPAQEFDIPNAPDNANNGSIMEEHYNDVIKYSEDGKSLLDKFIETGISEGESEAKDENEIKPPIENNSSNENENNSVIENEINSSIENNNASPRNFDGGYRKSRKSRKNRMNKSRKNFPNSINYKQNTNSRKKRKLRIKTRRNTIPI